MRFIESVEWLKFAVGLWDRQLSATLVRPVSVARHESVASLPPDASSSDVDDLIRLVGDGDLIERAAAVYLLAKAAIAHDPRLAARRDKLTQAFAELIERDHPETTASAWALQGWIQLAPRQADEFMTRRLCIDDVVPFEAAVSYQIAAGGFLRLGPGRVRVRTAWIRSPIVSSDLGEILIARLDVADDRGAVFRAYVPMFSYAPLDMLRVGEPIPADTPGRPVLSGLFCWSDRRQWLSGLKRDGHEQTAYALVEKYLSVHVDVMAHDGSASSGTASTGAFVRLHQQDYGVMDGRPLSAVAASGGLFGRTTLAPFGPFHRLVVPVFHPTAMTAAAQEHVHGDGQSEERAPLDPAGCHWTGLVRLLLGDYFRQPSISYGIHYLPTTLATSLAIDEAERFFLKVPLARPATDHALISALTALGTPAAIARLEALTHESDPAVARGAHQALSGLGKPVWDEIRRVSTEWRNTKSGEDLQWLWGVCNQSSAGIFRGETREAVIDAIAEIFGPPTETREESVTYTSNDGVSGSIYLRRSHPPHTGYEAGGGSYPSAPLTWSSLPRRSMPDPFSGHVESPVVLRFATEDGGSATFGPGFIRVRVGLIGEAPFRIAPEASDVRLTVEAIDNERRTCRFVRPLTSSLIAAWARQETASFSRTSGTRRSLREQAVALEHASIEWDDVRLSVSIEALEESESPVMMVRLTGMRTPATLHWITSYSAGGYDLGVELHRPDADAPVDAASERPWQTGALRLRCVAQMVLCPGFGRIDDRCEPIACTVVDAGG